MRSPGRVVGGPGGGRRGVQGRGTVLAPTLAPGERGVKALWGNWRAGRSPSQGDSAPPQKTLPLQDGIAIAPVSGSTFPGNSLFQKRSPWASAALAYDFFLPFCGSRARHRDELRGFSSLRRSLPLRERGQRPCGELESEDALPPRQPRRNFRQGTGISGAGGGRGLASLTRFYPPAGWQTSRLANQPIMNPFLGIQRPLVSTYQPGGYRGNYPVPGR